MRKAVLLPDIHFPEHSIFCMRLVLAFLKDFQPNIIVYQGDQLSLDMISFWNKGKPGNKEGKRLKDEVLDFNKHILLPHEKAVPKAKRIWLTGNHENRAYMYGNENPAMKGLIEPDLILDLRSRGYKIIHNNGQYRLGKLRVIHGFYWNLHHAKKTVDIFENSVVYGHVHNPQVHCKMSPVDVNNYHIATALGCLGELAPGYKAGKPTRWINQFGVVYIYENNDFSLYPVTITKSGFCFNDKHYK